MTTIRTRVTVGPDGKITVPIGIDEAGAEVEVVVTPLRPSITTEEYRAVIAQTKGSIDDPTFVRPPPWMINEREPLE